MIYPYVYDDTTIVPDEISGSRAGNTGLAYNPNLDEILVGVFNDDGYQSIWRYDRVTLTKVGEINLSISPSVANGALQGVAYNTETSNVYFTWDTRIYEIQYDGVDVRNLSIGVSSARRASIIFRAGYIYYLDVANSLIKRLDADTLTVDGTFSAQIPIPENNIEGLYYDGTYFYCGSDLSTIDRGHSILKFDNNGVIINSWDTIDNEMEGLSFIDGVFYQCKNRYYHDNVLNGNTIWRFYT